jgi:transcriptional antiterminator RfaH
MIMPAQLEPRTRSGAHWYAVQTRYRSERKVSGLLESQGVETFLPLLEEIHHWSDRRMPVEIPLFAGYGFVRVVLSAASRLDVLRTKGVIRFVNFGGEMTPIPAGQIDDLKMLLSKKIPCALHAFLKIGQKVRVRGGCLNGLEGILEQNGEKQLVISIASIARSVSIKIAGYELELI